MEAVSFSEQVYALCRQIPRGKVTTYRELGKALHTKGYRAIGQVLRCNPYAPHVPCHRVVRSDGKIGGFRGRTNGKEIAIKKQLLQQEKVFLVNDTVNLATYLHSFQ